MAENAVDVRVSGTQKHLRDYERISANGGGRSVAGKVQFYAGDLARFSASQALPVGKVSPLKLDLTQNLQRPFPKRSKQCIHEPSGEPPVPV